MHAVKRKARHVAHRRDEDSYGRLARWVPFARQFTPPPSQHGDDVESGLQRTTSGHSTGCVEESLETDRNPPHDPRIHHASTMPMSPVHHAEADQSSPEQTIVGSGSSPRSTDEVEQPIRRRFAGIIGSRSGDEKPGLGRAPSSTSRRSMRKKKFPIMRQLKAIFWTPVNVLLVCVPIGIALGNINNVNYIGKFVVNFLAIVPLAGLLSYATEEVAMRTGETLGGLLNASFGNAVELITAIIALTKNQITVVKTSLIGSMLSNLLLVLGMCFFFGGVGRTTQHFNVTVAQTAASLLALAVGSLLIPTFFDQGTDTGAPTSSVPPVSRAVAVLLLLVYFCYLFFQLSTHKDTYNAPSEKSPKKEKNIGFKRGIALMGAGTAAVPSRDKAPSPNQVYKRDVELEEEVEEPRIHIITAIILLIVSTAFVGVNSEYLVDAIPELVEQGGIAEEFVGLILIPIVGNAAEHATAVTVAIKDKMDLAIGVAIGSSLQIVLLVLPLITIIGWGLHNDAMTLEFDVFLIGLLFVSILLVNYLIQDGESHWLEGIMLMTMYTLIAVAAFFYRPTNSADSASF